MRFLVIFSNLLDVLTCYWTSFRSRGLNFFTWRIFFPVLLLYICRTVSWCTSDRPPIAEMEISEILPRASNMILIVGARNAYRVLVGILFFWKGERGILQLLFGRFGCKLCRFQFWSFTIRSVTWRFSTCAVQKASSHSYTEN